MKYALVCFTLFIHSISASPDEKDTATTLSCGTHRFVCVSTNQFVACENRNGKNEPNAAVRVSCPPDTFCQANGGSYPCLPIASTSNITTPSASAPGPNKKIIRRSVHDRVTCIRGTRTTASHCNTYYQCEGVLRYFYLKLVLHTCPLGEAFDADSSKCVPARYTNCVRAIKEAKAVKQALENPPKCQHTGNFPIITHNKCARIYYKCGMFKWGRMSLKHCPEGQIYDMHYNNCKRSDGCD